MVIRRLWLERVHELWQRRSIIWLTGVRRVGKTFLCRSIENSEYIDCELRSNRSRLADPEEFLPTIKGKTVVLDEIQYLDDPSNLLKIAADYYPDTKIVATGSSTLQASSKFSDTLTGRKLELWLTPVVCADLVDFCVNDLKLRMLRGGLPPFLLGYLDLDQQLQEWVSSFWAKDIQELFKLERRSGFFKLVELLMVASGGMFEATRYAAPCEIDRQTVMTYLRILEDTWVFHLIKPFSTRKSTEIVSAPKVYGFDTGFVCMYRSWDHLRNEDLGQLWEHLVLNELHAYVGRWPIKYWRDKRGHEVDFILTPRGEDPVAIECKWSKDGFNPANLEVFRRSYPKGKNILIASDIKKGSIKKFGQLEIELVPLNEVGERAQALISRKPVRTLS